MTQSWKLTKNKLTALAMPLFMMGTASLAGSESGNGKHCEVRKNFWGYYHAYDEKGSDIGSVDAGDALDRFKVTDLERSGRCDFDLGELHALADIKDTRFNEAFSIAHDQATGKLPSFHVTDTGCVNALSTQAKKYSRISETLKAQYALAVGKPYEPKVRSFGLLTSATGDGCALVTMAVTGATMGAGAPVAAGTCVAATGVAAVSDWLLHEDSEAAAQGSRDGSEEMKNQLAHEIAGLDGISDEKELLLQLLYGTTSNVPALKAQSLVQTFWESFGQGMSSQELFDLSTRHDWRDLIRVKFGSCENGKVPTLSDVISVMNDGADESADSLTASDDPRVSAILEVPKQPPSPQELAPRIASKGGDSR